MDWRSSRLAPRTSGSRRWSRAVAPIVPAGGVARFRLAPTADSRSSVAWRKRGAESRRRGRCSVAWQCDPYRRGAALPGLNRRVSQARNRPVSKRTRNWARASSLHLQARAGTGMRPAIARRRYCRPRAPPRGRPEPGSHRIVGGTNSVSRLVHRPREGIAVTLAAAPRYGGVRVPATGPRPRGRAMQAGLRAL